VADVSGWTPERYANYMAELGRSGHTEKPYVGHDEVLRLLRARAGDCARL
jgi:hypothetical protein